MKQLLELEGGKKTKTFPETFPNQTYHKKKGLEAQRGPFVAQDLNQKIASKNKLLDSKLLLRDQTIMSQE